MLKTTIFFFFALAFMLGIYSEKVHAVDWSADDLESQFASWGISPEDKLPSINLLGAWQKFKPKKEVVVLACVRRDRVGSGRCRYWRGWQSSFSCG